MDVTWKTGFRLAGRSRTASPAVGDSRINIAGLNADTVPVLAEAIAEVVRG